MIDLMELHPKAVSLHDLEYRFGKLPPHYLVPAILVRVGWMPSGSGWMLGRPYWYISTPRLLWTIWKHRGIVEQRR